MCCCGYKHSGVAVKEAVFIKNDLCFYIIQQVIFSNRDLLDIFSSLKISIKC